MVHAKTQYSQMFAADRGIAYVRLPCFMHTAADIARWVGRVQVWGR